MTVDADDERYVRATPTRHGAMATQFPAFLGLDPQIAGKSLAIDVSWPQLARPAEGDAALKSSTVQLRSVLGSDRTSTFQSNLV